MSEHEQGSTLHPAEHRAYRELYLSCRQLLVRWRRLAKALADTPFAGSLELGAEPVRQLLQELKPRTAAHGVFGGPAAQGAGVGLARLRTGVADRTVDTGMAARFAVLDIEHVTTLLLQLAELARTRGDGELERFCSGWATRLRSVVRDVRAAAVAIGADPERTGTPLDPSPIGQAIHRAGWAVGSLGEWFDRRVAGRATPDSSEGQDPRR
jgi:hypothetical protein